MVEIEQEIDRGGGDALYSSTPNFVYDERETEDEFKTDFSSIKKQKENFRFLTISISLSSTFSCLSCCVGVVLVKNQSANESTNCDKLIFIGRLNNEEHHLNFSVFFFSCVLSCSSICIKKKTIHGSDLI